MHMYKQKETNENVFRYSNLQTNCCLKVFKTWTNVQEAGDQYTIKNPEMTIDSVSHVLLMTS